MIDPATGKWDETLINDIFNPLDVKRILRIPLGEHLSEDFVAWHNTKSYMFSVKSAYYIEWDHAHRHRLTRADGQGTATRNPVWDILWKLKVSSKVKKLAGKLCMA